MTPTHDVAIVGGGLAGLVAARELSDRDVVVLEADERVGGRLASLPRPPYWLNLGAHLFPGDGSLTGSLVDELGLATERVHGDEPFAVAFGSRVIRPSHPALYPFRLPLSVSGRASLVRAGWRLMRAARSARRDQAERERLDPTSRRRRSLAFMGDESFADFIGKLHPEVEAIFGAMTSRVTASMSEQSAGCGVEHYLQTSQGVDSSYIRVLEGGSSRLPEALARTLGDRVVTGATVERVAPGPGGAEVTYVRDGQRAVVRARHAIVATPAYVTARLVDGLDADTRSALAAVPYGPIVVVAVLTDEREPMPWDDLYAIELVGASFNVFTNQANVARGGPRQPGGSLMLYASGPVARPHLDRPDDAVAADFLADATALFPQLSGQAREVVVHRWPRAVPYVAPHRHRLQEMLERPYGHVSLAGDYFDYASMEGAVETALGAARRARAVLAEG